VYKVFISIYWIQCGITTGGSFSSIGKRHGTVKSSISSTAVSSFSSCRRRRRYSQREAIFRAMEAADTARRLAAAQRTPASRAANDAALHPCVFSYGRRQIFELRCHVPRHGAIVDFPK
jgi:hypothetical protein